jgi:hypothetical protein
VKAFLPNEGSPSNTYTADQHPFLASAFSSDPHSGSFRTISENASQKNLPHQTVRSSPQTGLLPIRQCGSVLQEVCFNSPAI